jgi:fatty-acyl-CoA synthase
VSTIPAAFLEAVSRRAGAHVFQLEDGPTRLGGDELAERAARGARWLASRGIGPGDRVGIMGANRPEWVIGAHASWMAGAAVVPIQFPLRMRDPDALSERVRSLARAGGCTLVLSAPALTFLLPELAVDWDVLERGGGTEPSAPRPGDPAIIQFTSGSTSQPKGSVISHAAALAQVAATGGTMRPDPADEVILGWAPFFHDLGLSLFIVTGAVLGATCQLLPTERFARDPAEWLRLVPEVEASYTIAPQSGWAAAFRAARRLPAPLDLRPVESALFAAEAIDPAFLDRMTSLGEEIGLGADAMGATYGLAEAVLGVTATGRGQRIRVHEIDREVLASESRAIPPERAARRVVSCGPPLTGFAVRIASGDESVPDGRVGEVQVRGESVMSSYLDDDDGGFADGWLRTGDLGYLHEGELYVTGRAKDVLIVMGHNHYPEDFEWAASRVEGVRHGRCAAFVDSARDQIVLLVEASGDEPGPGLAHTVRRSVADAVGTAPGEVVVVPRDSIEKTTSGKLRRAAMREAYERGAVPARA